MNVKYVCLYKHIYHLIRTSNIFLILICNFLFVCCKDRVIVTKQAFLRLTLSACITGTRINYMVCIYYYVICDLLRYIRLALSDNIWRNNLDSMVCLEQMEIFFSSHPFQVTDFYLLEVVNIHHFFHRLKGTPWFSCYLYLLCRFCI